MPDFENKISPAQKEQEIILSDIRKGKTDGIGQFRDLLERFPDFLPAMGDLAWALAKKNRHEEAIALYEKYLAIQPANPEPRWRIGDRLINLGRLDEAIDSYQRVLEKRPNCEDAATGLKYIKYLKQKTDKTSKVDVPIPSQLSPLQKENLELNKKEYNEKRLHLKSHPPQLYLESTTKCNFFCRTCEKGYAPYYAEDLRPEIWEKVRAEAMPWIVTISITGFGEPTMASNFDSILETSLHNGSHVHFVTNASLLNFPRIEQLTRYPVKIQISLDGATKKTFEDIRTGGNFEQVCERLAMIKKLRDIHLSEVYSEFSLIFVALRKNIHELPDVIRLAHRYGIMKVWVADYDLGGREFDEQSLRREPQKANNLLHEAQTVAEELGVELVLPAPYSEKQPPPAKSGLWKKIISARRLFPKPKRFPQRCHSPWSEPYIHNNGIITPCCASNQFLGDLNKTPFFQIWNGWRYKLMRWRIESPLPALGCRRCFVIWGINGGNAGSVLAQEGLLIKMFYYMETRILSLAQKIYQLFRGAPQTPIPNYVKGRPIINKEVP